jgi:ABC-type multidrug transport system fused ATPase/permease subunit
MSLPRLVDGERRLLFAGLVTTGAVQAGIAAISSGLVSTAVTTQSLLLLPAAGLLACALLAGSAGLLERWVGEKLAQSYVLTLRQKLFAAAIPAIGRVEEARLVLPFVGDLSAVRNWAARGPAALLTAGVASTSGAILLAAQYPALAAGLLPLLAATLLLLLLYRRLGGRIAQQRQSRAQLTRFVLRRLRVPAEAALPAQQRVSRADRRRLDARAERSAAMAIRRATMVGLMDGVALTGGSLTVLALLALGSSDQRALIAALGLAGFAAARLLDVARALHALAGGGVALEQITTRLNNAEARTLAGKAALPPPSASIEE